MKSTSCHLVVLLTTLAGCFSNFAWGQEAADLLGSGALMQHPNAATLLKLDEDQQAKTTEWVDARLEQAANFLAEADLETDAGKVAGLAFIDESESQLQGVLDPRQQELVELVYEASAGFPALRIDSVTAALQLSEKQKKEIVELLDKRQAEFDADSDVNEDAINGKYELMIKRIFQPTQLAAWRVMTLEVAGEMPKIAVEAEVAAAPADDTSKAVAEADSIKITFSFGQMDWEPLIEWFAEQAELSLQLETPLPDGTFSYKDKREYTVAESIDLLNNVLMLKGVTLVRNDQQLMVVDLEEIPEQLIPVVEPQELDKRGRYEIVSCVFSLEFARAGDLEPEISDLVNENYGSTVSIPLSNQLVIRETVGNLRSIRAIVEDAEKRAEAQKRPVQTLDLQYITTEEAMLLVRSLFNIDDDDSSDDDETIWVQPDSLGMRLFYRGEEDRVEQLLQLLGEADRQPSGDLTIDEDEFSLRAYSVRANPEMVLKVLQTLLANLHPDIRVEVAPETRSVVLYGRESDHLRAEETIEQLQGNSVDFGVVDLRDYDPEGVTEILVSAGLIADPLLEDDSTEYLAKVVVDPLRNRLLIRGTKAQVEEITRFVEGIDPPRSTEGAERSSARLIPITGDEASQAMRRIETLWQTTERSNRLQFKVVGEDNPRIRQRDIPEGYLETPELKPEIEPAPEKPDTAGDPSASIKKPSWKFTRVSSELATKQASATQQIGEDNPDVFVEKTPYGLIIRSDDLDALDALEDLIRDTVGLESGIPIPTVFYLRNRGAQEAQDLLGEMLGLSSSSSGGGGGLGMLGGLAGNMIGGAAGDIVGGMLGGGGSMMGGGSSGMFLETTGDVGMVADPKLNALVVQANEEDLGLIEELLEFIDQEEPPVPPELEGTTKVVPIRYQDASQVATIVKEQLADFIKGSNNQGGGGGQNAQAQAQQKIIEALMGRNGRGGRGGGGGGGADIEPVKLAVSVEANTNSLVLTGPAYLQDKVIEIVQQLDLPELQEKQFIQVIPIGGKINPELLRAGLEAAFSAEPTSNSSSPSSPSRPSTGGSSSSASDDARRQAIQQWFQQRAMQGGFGSRGSTPQSGGRGGSTGGPGGRGGSSGGPGGRGGR